ncbi:TonB family protein [Novosphingobium mangrovi (ex Hu et al. 2023)]|uniref:Energy transducer TonB n=1 Tax=Novosphingobium mangrovi (ex Hu et al. 2023) TaxID=2930094 RepID=A0ABT0AAU2_9SPHN|nr:TonB family protein [Novosphingobium mangrovi (ex Hu et al. 2023)]MCJ1960313.1 energy transducer TonB [Novosphingobium mangrovi (ex Hu et al. 2023)]
MRRTGWAIATVCGLLTAPDAQAKPDTFVLEASSPWNVDWADNACLLQRMYGEGEEGVLLRFMNFTPDYTYQIQLTGGPAKLNLPHRDIDVAFAPFPSYEADAIAAKVDDTYDSLLFTTEIAIDHDELDRMDADQRASALAKGEEPNPHFVRPVAGEVDHFDVDLGPRTLRFNTGALEKPLAALRTCTRDLLRQWGVDPDVQDQVAYEARPAGDGELRRQMGLKFPRNLIRKGAQARVNVVVTVDPQGKMQGCRVPLSQNDPRFDELVCERMTNLTFEPARLADDTPVTSYWAVTATFILN